MKNMNLEKLTGKVLDLIDTKINPVLAKHNGFVILITVEVEEDIIKVILEFYGECKSCDSRFSSTSEMIEGFLKKELDTEDLVVLNVELL